MAIETLDDIISKVADRLGIYGAHGDEDGEGAEAITCSDRKPCRMCFESDLRERILAAVEVERKLYPSATPASGEVVPLAEDKEKNKSDEL